MLEWFKHNETVLEWLGALSAISFLGSLIAVPVLVARIPEDYFCRSRDTEHSFRHRHPIAVVIVLIIKNVLGFFVLLSGIAMLVLPGQGLLTVLLGLMLLNFPGKRRLEMTLIRNRNVLSAVNWIRHKAGRSPLKID